MDEIVSVLTVSALRVGVRADSYIFRRALEVGLVALADGRSCEESCWFARTTLVDLVGAGGRDGSSEAA